MSSKLFVVCRLQLESEKFLASWDAAVRGKALCCTSSPDSSTPMKAKSNFQPSKCRLGLDICFSRMERFRGGQWSAISHIPWKSAERRANSEYRVPGSYVLWSGWIRFNIWISTRMNSQAAKFGESNLRWLSPSCRKSYLLTNLPVLLTGSRDDSFNE